MGHFNRRDFLQRSATFAAAGMIVPHWALGQSQKNLDFPLGFQSWVVREPLVKDFPGTLKMMAGYGYESVEMCSPPGYSKYGFGPLTKLKAAEMKKIINDQGLNCTSCHYTFNELEESAQERIEFAKELGLDQMIVSSPGLPDDASLDDWKSRTQAINKIGMVAREHDIQFGYHNHNFEFKKLEGQLIYDMLLKELDPTLVKMQFQVWVVIAGYKAADYFRKHPGRFISAHLSDWSGSGDNQVPLGDGVVDWPDFFEASRKGGVKNIFVEMAPPTLEKSAAYLKSL